MFAGQNLGEFVYLSILSRMVQQKTGIEMDGVSGRSYFISFYLFPRVLRLGIAFN